MSTASANPTKPNSEIALYKVSMSSLRTDVFRPSFPCLCCWFFIRATTNVYFGLCETRQTCSPCTRKTSSCCVFRKPKSCIWISESLASCRRKHFKTVHPLLTHILLLDLHELMSSTLIIKSKINQSESGHFVCL